MVKKKKYKIAENFTKIKKRQLIEKINTKIFETDNFCSCRICGYANFNNKNRRAIFNHIKLKHLNIKGSLFT